MSKKFLAQTGLDLQNDHYSIFIGRLDIFSFICATDKVWITELILIHKRIKSVRSVHAQVYRSIWRKAHYDVIDKSSSISSEGLDRHYHKYSSSSCWTRWDINHNVCLDIQNSHYSMYICLFLRFLNDMEIYWFHKKSDMKG